MQKKQKNSWVELCRFLASFCVIWLHFEYAPIPDFQTGSVQRMRGAAIFVEYFFMMSGYFAMTHVKKEQSKGVTFEERHIMDYTLKKYLHFLPYSVLAVLIMYTGVCLLREETFKSGLELWMQAPLEALLLCNTGFLANDLVSPLWYLSAMLIALPVVLFFVVRWEKITKYYLTWILPLLIYGFLIQKYGTVIQVPWWAADLRAFAGLFAGISLYYLASWLKRFSFSRSFKAVALIFETGLFAAVIVSTTVDSWSWSQMDSVFISMIYVSLAITFSGQTITSSFTSAICNYLGKLSFPVYCFHWPVIYLLRYLQMRTLWQPNIWSLMAIVFCVSILLSIGLMAFVEKLLPEFGKKLKRMVFSS